MLTVEKTKKAGRPKKTDNSINIVFTRKSIGAVQMSNDLNLLERKVMNILIKNAQEIENKKDKNKQINENGNILFAIDFAMIETLLNIEKYHQRKDIANALEKLVETSLKFNILQKDNTTSNWNVKTSLLAEIRYKDKTDNRFLEEIYYQFSATIKETLINPKLYAPLTLNIQKNIHSRHSLALWEYLNSELSARSTDECETKPIPINDYVYLVAGSKVNYDSFKGINRSLIKKPLEEVNKKSDLTAEAITHKKGRKVIGISHYITRKEQFQMPLFDVNRNEQLKQEKLQESLDCDEHSKNIDLEVSKNNIAINEALLKLKVSEKKRIEFVAKYKENYILENIEEARMYADKRKSDISAPLVIKAIEENWANSGPEKEALIEKNKDIADLWMMIFDYKGFNSGAELLNQYQYIGTTIYCFKKVAEATEEDFISHTRFRNVRAEFGSLADFKDAVVKYTKEELKKIECKLNKIQEKYNLSLNDICQIRGSTKEELFKKMGVSEKEFIKLGQDLLKPL